MGTFSFFSPRQHVYKISLKALELRNYKVVNVDEKQGTITAVKKKTFISPGIDLKIKIEEISGEQTRIDVTSKEFESAMLYGNIEGEETKFFRTLFRCFDHI